MSAHSAAALACMALGPPGAYPVCAARPMFAFRFVLLRAPCRSPWRLPLDACPRALLLCSPTFSRLVVRQRALSAHSADVGSCPPAACPTRPAVRGQFHTLPSSGGRRGVGCSASFTPWPRDLLVVTRGRVHDGPALCACMGHAFACRGLCCDDSVVGTQCWTPYYILS